ncbi:MAG: Wzz/FepE/Etk N-terminal domain-containing protein [Bacillota bacterium]
MEENNKNIKNAMFDVRDIFAIIANNLLKIILVALLFGLISYTVTSVFVTKVYQAEANLALEISEKSDLTKVTYSDILLSQQLVETYSIIIKSDDVIKKVFDELHLSDSFSQEELKNKITATGVKNTQILKVSIQHNDPTEAQIIINKLSEVASEYISKSFRGARLVTINKAIKGSPISPSLPLNTMVAFLFGAALVIILEILKEYLDDTIKSEEQIKQMFGINILGLLPEIDIQNQEVFDEEKTEGGEKNA